MKQEELGINEVNDKLLEKEIRVLQDKISDCYGIYTSDYPVDEMYKLLGYLCQYLKRVDKKRTLEFVEGQISLMEM